MEKKLVGNYTKRCEAASVIQNKLKAGEGLTEEEIKMVCTALEDPLGEFCLREGTFRLIEIMNVDIEKANSLEDEAAQAIRDNIDTNEDLYDSIDYSLKYEVLNEHDDEEDYDDEDEEEDD